MLTRDIRCPDDLDQCQGRCGVGMVLNRMFQRRERLREN